MSDRTAIEWTDATWNPVTGCTEVSPGCDHCYAKTFAERWRGIPGHHFEHGFDVQLRPAKLEEPLRWRKPRLVFVNSMSDLFHDSVPDEYIIRVFGIMAAAWEHTFQVLTKRHGRMRALLSSEGFLERIALAGAVQTDDADLVHDRILVGQWPLPNVWLGCSVESQKWANIRVPALLDTPAAVRFLSCEPLLGPVDLHSCDGVDAIERDWCGSPAGGMGAPHPLLNWVIVGGESGPGARPMHPDWARSLRDQCQAADLPFFFKQWGAWAPGVPGSWSSRTVRLRQDGTSYSSVEKQESENDAYLFAPRSKSLRVLDGRTWDEMPEVGAS